MGSRSGETGCGRELRFFLARAPEGGTAELLASEAGHALRVLRLRPGDRVVGLDGRGGAWPLAVAAVENGRLSLAQAGEPRLDPRPGDPLAPLPWVEIAAAWPKVGRAEEMLDRLTQLGAALVAPLEAERVGPGSHDPSPARRERLERVLREACKQCGRTWVPALGAVLQIGEIAASPRGDLASSPETLLWLDPSAETTVAAWARERRDSGGAQWTPEHPLRVLVGPEGGFTVEEKRKLLERGAAAASLGPHVLRVETAAEAAMAVLAATLLKARRS